MFPSRSPYLRLSILLGLFIPAFVGGLFLAFSTSESAPREHRHQRVVTQHQAEVQALKSLQQEYLRNLDAAKTAEVESEVSTAEKERDVFKIVEQMPLFPGQKCGAMLDYKKRKECADRAMLNYVYSNIKYPKRARDKKITGMAVVSFIIEAHGAISTVKIVRDPGGGLGEAAAKVIRKMQQDNLRWEPGLQRGKPVAVQFNLPVKFKLE